MKEKNEKVQKTFDESILLTKLDQDKKPFKELVSHFKTGITMYIFQILNFN